MSKKPNYQFRLYVAGSSPNSRQALLNLKRFGEARLESDYSLEVIDILQEGRRAWEEGVLVTPALYVLKPEPELRIVGNLSDEAVLFQALQRGNPIEPAPPV